MAGLDANGLVTKTLEEIKLEIETELRSKISTTINTASDSPLGQLIGIFSSQLRQVWELAEAVYASQFPDTAEGFSLASLARITGTIKEAATKSTVLATVNIDPGTYAIGTLIAHVAGDPTARFVNSEAAVNGGGVAADVDVNFEAEDTGPIRANANTLTIIAEPVTGWNSVDNDEDATLGTIEESDTALRLRRETELQGKGSTTVDGIRVDVLKVDGVVSAKVYENTSAVTDGEGRPPHSIEVVLRPEAASPTAEFWEAVGEAIWNSKAAGIEAYGTDTVTITDSMGIDHAIGYSEPDEIEVYLRVSLNAYADEYGGDDAVKEALVDFGDTTYQAGDQVFYTRLIAEVFTIPGVIAALVETSLDGITYAAAGIPIGEREIAVLDTSRITVIATLE